MRTVLHLVLVVAAVAATAPALADKNEDIPRLGDASHPLTTVCGWLDPRHPIGPPDDQPSDMSDEDFDRWRDEVRDAQALAEFGFASALEWMYGLAGCR